MEKKKFVRKQERFVLFLMLLLLFPLGALAQQKLIKGQVVDEWENLLSVLQSW